jgi:hypothetical protein
MRAKGVLSTTAYGKRKDHKRLSEKNVDAAELYKAREGFRVSFSALPILFLAESSRSTACPRVSNVPKHVSFYNFSFAFPQKNGLADV